MWGVQGKEKLPFLNASKTTQVKIVHLDANLTCQLIYVGPHFGVKERNNLLMHIFIVQLIRKEFCSAQIGRHLRLFSLLSSTVSANMFSLLYTEDKARCSRYICP